MTNTLICGVVVMFVGVLCMGISVSIPQRSLMEPSLWILVGGMTIGGLSPVVGIILWAARRICR